MKIDMKYYKIFFPVIVLLLLVFPLIKMNTAQITKKENRTLAKFPKISGKEGVNTKFGKEFESWLGDRFWGREQLIEVNFQTLYKINGRIENDRAVMTSDGMAFGKKMVKDFCRPIDKKQFNKIKTNLAKLKKWSKEHNIKLYVLIPPDKEDVFIDQIPNIPLKCKKNSAQDFVSKIKKEIDMDILYPRDLYKKKYKEFTHAHTDHHWTEFGAFLTYQQLSKRIKKDFKNFQTLSEADFNVFHNVKPREGYFKNLFDRPFYEGSNCFQLGLSLKQCPLTHEYAYYDHKDKEQLKVEFGPIKMSRRTKYLKSKNKLKVALLGASHGGFLMPFLPYSVKEVLMLRVNNEEKDVKNIYDMKRFEKHILDFKPDILLLYMSSPHLRNFAKLYETEEKKKTSENKSKKT